MNKNNFDSISICYLFSYLNPKNEIKTINFLKNVFKDKYFSLSHEVCPEFREFERFSTTVINSYIGPKLKIYLHFFMHSLEDHYELQVRGRFELLLSLNLERLA